MSTTTDITLAASLIDELTAILAVADPEPAESWIYKIGNLPIGMVVGRLKSIGQIHDLLVSLPHDCFLIVQQERSPWVFTQAWRKGNSFQTECSAPERKDSEDGGKDRGHNIRRYCFTGGDNLPLVLAQQVMAAYVQSEGSLPEITGLQHKIEPY
ncbi:hypothetical protein [Brevibacterium otitidis]|uniref:YdhG-like domain-containing protein n=1 Tax=Brevibacterium otitidis TaxID=53364 RepID=A0ABV5WYP0_9MICO|nr:hypothetical protein GCM10023233_31190 [Brevibacterium otitidis]